MSIHRLIHRLALATACLAALAFTGGLHAAPAPETLHGMWEISQTKGGQSLLGYSTFEADGTGASVARMTMQGQTLWMVILFTWTVEGDKITQAVVRSNVAALKPGVTTTDTIVLLDESNYHHRSGKALEKEVRVTQIPAEFEEKLTRFRSR